MASNDQLNDKHCVDDEARSSFKFFERLSRDPVISRAVTDGVESYHKLKRATPSMIQIGLQFFEVTLLKILEFVIPHWHGLPLRFPLRYADDIACAALDTAELVYSSSMVQRLKSWVIRDDTVRSEGDYVSRLIKFAKDTTAMPMATDEMKSTVRPFLEEQVALLGEVDKIVDSFYDDQKRKDSGNAVSETTESYVDRIKTTFENVMAQRNLQTSFCGDSNPLEFAWTHLHELVQSLTPEERAIMRVGQKIYYMRTVLTGTMEAVDLAAERQKARTRRASEFFAHVSAIAFALVPQSALSCLRNSSTYNAVVRRLSRSQDTVDSRDPVSINVDSGTPRPLPLRRKNGIADMSKFIDQSALLAVRQDHDANESGGSSDGHSGQENLSDPGERSRESKSRRRKRKALGKETNSL